MTKYLLPAFLFLAGCVSIDAEEPQICKSAQITIPAIPAIGNYSASNTINMKIDGIDVFDELQFVGGTLDGDGLMDVSSVVINIDTATVANLNTNNETTIDIPANSTNLAPVIQSNADFSVTLTLSGTTILPTTEWTLNADFCFGGKISKHYGL